MHSNAFLCPTCKVELSATPAEDVGRCPKCGNYFSTKQQKLVWPETKTSVMGILGWALIYIVGTGALLLAVVFAGCLLLGPIDMR